MIDSMIVQAQIQREIHRFKPFVVTRSSEIQEKTNPSEWLCIPSDQNSADLTTRIKNLIKLKEHSMWQRGPEFPKQS